MNFTGEVERDDKLSFLDISISRNGTKFETSVYRKPTFSGVFTNYTSYIDTSYKRGLIYSLLHRGFTICCSYEKLHEEISYLKSVFQKNAYPTYFIDRCVRIFLDKVFITKTTSYDVPKKVVKFILPFMGRLSLQIRTRLQKILSKKVPGSQLRFITKSTRRLRNIFSTKDVLPTGLRSYVVYQFKCRCCNALYYGKSYRHFQHRSCEHLGISHLTGKKYKSPKSSAISDHLLLTGHAANLKDFKIISHEPSKSSFKLLLRESLLIYRDRPSLNKTAYSYPLALFHD